LENFRSFCSRVPTGSARLYKSMLQLRFIAGHKEISYNLRASAWSADGKSAGAGGL